MKEMTSNQRRVFIDAAQLFDAYRAAFRKNRSYRGGMHWKKSKGREYLFRTRDRNGYGRSLGPRSPETEKTLAEFRRSKAASKDRLDGLKARLTEQARFCRAALIQRVPRVVTAILRVLDNHRMLGKNVMVVGTNALYAYEAAAGVFLDRPVLATGDMDILWDVRTKLTLTEDGGIREAGLLGVLKKADRSFEPLRAGDFRAVNRDGFRVDLIKPDPARIQVKDPRRMGDDGDLAAAEIRNLQWLLSAPKFSQIVIGDDGYPGPITVPDPRAYTLHKLWISQQPDRNPLKKKRDREQALTTARLTVNYLPAHPFEESALRMFPKAVVIKEKETLSGADAPPGL